MDWQGLDATEAGVGVMPISESMKYRYWTRVARACARDHANRDQIDLMQRAIEDHLSHYKSMGHAGFAVEYYRQLDYDYRGDQSWRVECLPWPCIRLEEVRLILDTKSTCWMTVEVTYGTKGERAIYGISKWDGSPRLFAD